MIDEQINTEHLHCTYITDPHIMYIEAAWLLSPNLEILWVPSTFFPSKKKEEKKCEGFSYGYTHASVVQVYFPRNTFASLALYTLICTYNNVGWQNMVN